MEYMNIASELREYIRKSAYNKLDDNGKELYIKYIKRLLNKLEETLVVKKLDDMAIGREKTSRRISFVGMRYHGEHYFTADDDVRLEKEDDNPVDTNAVKVVLKGRKKWKHVAYVAKEDAKWLRTVDDFEGLSLEYISTFYASAVYKIWIE
jgi:hypothetical protein